MNATWEEIDRPAGPQPIPSWCKDVHIEWMDGYPQAIRHAAPTRAAAE